LKKYVLIYIAMAVAVLICFLVFADTIQHSNAEVDTIAVNEMIQQITQNWGNFEGLDTGNFPYRFFIVDGSGERVYATAENLPTSAISAIRIGFLPMSISVDGQMLGTVLFETSHAYVHHVGSSVNNQVVVAFVLLLLLNVVFVLVLYITVIGPFKRIQQFAHKISLGILDEALPIYRDNIFGLFTQSFDIMRESLQDARKKQHNAERERKELIASLSHDIKTPVTSIRLITELLQVSTQDTAIAEKLKTIEVKANQIDRLMNDMLHSALEELGELNVSPVSTDSSVLAGIFKNADHLSRVKLGHVPSCLVEIDTVRMEQVIGNIVTNSYKYAGTDIDVSFNAHGEGLQVDISDHGSGVEPEEIELITTKFYRGTSAKALQKEGEGLGLYVSKQLMEKMGGGIEAFNSDGGFTVRLWVKLSQ